MFTRGRQAARSYGVGVRRRPPRDRQSLGAPSLAPSSFLSHRTRRFAAGSVGAPFGPMESCSETPRSSFTITLSCRSNPSAGMPCTRPHISEAP